LKLQVEDYRSRFKIEKELAGTHGSVEYTNVNPFFQDERVEELVVVQDYQVEVEIKEEDIGRGD